MTRLIIRLPLSDDVWTNYVQSFLLPSVVQARKCMGVVHFEFQRQVNHRSWGDSPDNDVRCSDLEIQLRSRSFWLNLNMAVMVSPTNQYDSGFEPSYHLLHVSDDGIVHCSQLMVLSLGRSSRVPYSFRRRHTLLFLERHEITYIRNASSDHDVCPCMWRAVVLRAIRNK